MLDNDTEPQIAWCPYCGKDIWFISHPGLKPEDLICSECKKVLDTYNNYEQARQV